MSLLHLPQLQGEEQIVSHKETAYPVAALAVGLWCRFPDLGDLLLGHFYMRCPALVPVFFSRNAVASETEYLRLVHIYSTSKHSAIA